MKKYREYRICTQAGSEENTMVFRDRYEAYAKYDELLEASEVSYCRFYRVYVIEDNGYADEYDEYTLAGFIVDSEGTEEF